MAPPSQAPASGSAAPTAAGPMGVTEQRPPVHTSAPRRGRYEAVKCEGERSCLASDVCVTAFTLQEGEQMRVDKASNHRPTPSKCETCAEQRRRVSRTMQVIFVPADMQRACRWGEWLSSSIQPRPGLPATPDVSVRPLLTPNPRSLSLRALIAALAQNTLVIVLLSTVARYLLSPHNKNRIISPRRTRPISSRCIPSTRALCIPPEPGPPLLLPTISNTCRDTSAPQRSDFDTRDELPNPPELGCDDTVAVRGVSSMDPSDSQAQSSGASKTSASPANKPPGSDVKPRLTKDQHDVLEHHFLQQHKPSTNTKKDFANKLGVPLDKINNWFQNRRAKVKQDRKKAANQYQMTMGMSYGHQHMPVVSGQYVHPQEQQFSQMHMQAPDYYTINADISPASHPVQNLDGPSALELGPQISLQQQQQSYDMQHTLRSIPEANRTASYHPNPSAMMHTIMAATNGAYMHNSGMPTSTQDVDFSYHNNGLPHAYSVDDVTFAVPATATSDLAPSHPEFTGFADFNIDYSTVATSGTNNSVSLNAQQSTSSISSAPSPFSGAQSTATNQSPNGPTPSSIASVTSLYTGWTDDQSQLVQPKQEDLEDPFVTPYTMLQASASEQTLPFWGQTGSNQVYPQSNFYQQSNASAHAVLSSPEQDRKFSAAPSDFDVSLPFQEDGFARRNSSTSNLANNMDAIHIRNGTPDEFKQPNQPSSIAARRQKRPIALNSTAMRSASYSAALPSPGGNGDHTLRRIRSSGIPNAAGRVQKSQPGSAQRSPMTLSFSEAAASPKFARAFSSSGANTIGQGGSLCPPTPLTPQDFGGSMWQSNTVIRPHSVMPEHNSPESMHTNWSSDQAGNVLAKSGSPPSTSLDLQARFINDALYRDTPPQSAPATQQSFPQSSFMQRPQMRSGFHSTTDLTIQQPKPSHFRRPSLPDTAQVQGEDPNAQYYQGSNLNFADYKDVSLDGIHHNVPFAPPQHMVPQFLVHEYSPPHGTDPNGNFVRRTTEPQPKSYIFANQGPGDFRAQ